MLKTFSQVIIILLLLHSSILFAEDIKESRRWRLGFDMLEKPTRIVVTEPDGIQNVYWYFRYIVRNDTDRDIRYSINIKLVVDKPAFGVTESEVPNLFYNAEIPAPLVKKVEGKENYGLAGSERNVFNTLSSQYPRSIPDIMNQVNLSHEEVEAVLGKLIEKKYCIMGTKEEYVNSLQKYYDTDFPIVKKQIFSQLNMHPELTDDEHKVLKTLPDQYSRSIFDIMKEVNRSYAEVEVALEKLTSKNLAVAEEVIGAPIFLEGKISYANFSINNENIVQRKGDTIGGWEIVSFSRNDVILKKDNVVKKVTAGSVIDYRYARSNKTPFEKDPYYYGGSSAQGTYKGRVEEGDEKHNYERNIIPKKSVHRGIAVFYGVSPETDYMAVVVSGLVNPIVRRYKIVYAVNEVYMMGYKIPGDEISIHRDQLVHLYNKWEVLSTRIVRQSEK